jgi:hypothetical protein
MDGIFVYFMRRCRYKALQRTCETGSTGCFRTLAALRDAPLPKLLSGELRVPVKLG